MAIPLRNLVTTIVVIILFGGVLFVAERNRQTKIAGGFSTSHEQVQKVSVSGETLRAAGRIQGRSERIELRARLAEQIEAIHVTEGQWVSAGEVLMTLESDRFGKERDLAAAMFSIELAKQERLENGLRPSEIETARQEYQAAMARLAGAEKAYARGVKLSQSDAVSGQTLDNLDADVQSLRAQAAAARGRLETMELPPRDDDRLAASAAVKAAESRLGIAQINFDRTRIKAPVDGRVLAIEAEPGELTGPDSREPLIVLADTTQLRTVAEVDEFDALKVKLGQSCHITSDGTTGILARGRIVEIEPQMHAKRLFGQWAGERTDTHTRRVWIELEGKVDLPIGLPVDVFIETL